jgi:uncharacterized membrane protein
MYYLPVSIALFFLFILLVPLLFALAPAVAFAKLGLEPVLGYVFFLLCLLGGGINIPIHRESVSSAIGPDEFSAMMQQFFGIRLPSYNQRVLAVNLGGAVLPSLLSVYLLTFTPLLQVCFATVMTSVASYMLSKPVKGVGITMPAFIPPVIAAIVALLITREHAPQVAYISGVMGVLIGADLLRLRYIKKLGVHYLSIGGAGVFDGIYLVGIVSVLLA